MIKARQIFLTDTLVAAACVILYAVLLALIGDNVTLMEGDIYRMLFGILNGEVTGARVLDPMHYGTSFSFGYLQFIYSFAGDAALHHPGEIIAFINRLGYYAAIGTLCFMWLALALAYDSLVATAALFIFGLSPVFITLGASGHPILPAYLFLMAGAAAIFWQGEGWKLIVCRLAAVVLLAVGMSMRADILLALPWIALTQRDVSSWHDYCKKVFRSGLFY